MYYVLEPGCLSSRKQFRISSQFAVRYFCKKKNFFKFELLLNLLKTTKIEHRVSMHPLPKLPRQQHLLQLECNHQNQKKNTGTIPLTTGFSEASPGFPFRLFFCSRTPSGSFSSQSATADNSSLVFVFRDFGTLGRYW